MTKELAPHHCLAKLIENVIITIQIARVPQLGMSIAAHGRWDMSHDEDASPLSRNLGHLQLILQPRKLAQWVIII